MFNHVAVALGGSQGQKTTPGHHVTSHHAHPPRAVCKVLCRVELLLVVRAGLGLGASGGRGGGRGRGGGGAGLGRVLLRLLLRGRFRLQLVRFCVSF